MMTQAFYTGLSGLKTYQSSIDANADNIANISTIGYREYTLEYSSLFETTLNTTNSHGSSVSNIGVGSSIQSSSMNLSSGALALTQRSTDLAIYGDGWFGVSGKNGTLYTRAGNFTFDVNSDLVTADGMYVLGTMANNINGTTLTKSVSEVSLGNVNTQEKLSFPNTLTYPPVPTTNASFIMNLGVEDELRTISAGAIDSSGNRNELKLSFEKSAVQVPPGIQWDVVATTQSLDGKTIYDTQTGVVSFDASGALLSNTLSTIDNNGTPVSISLGDGYTGVISINTPATSGSSSADGVIGGELLGYEINKNAEVIATFSNGMQSSVAKIAVYHFQNDQGLTRTTGSNFQASNNSGKPIFFTDANGQNILGTDVRNFTLENSNVKIDTAMTELIIYQRAFDSCSKVVTTADEMMKKALEMDA